jgi:hypothetical protein
VTDSTCNTSFLQTTSVVDAVCHDIGGAGFEIESSAGFDIIPLLIILEVRMLYPIQVTKIGAGHSAMTSNRLDAVCPPRSTRMSILSLRTLVAMSSAAISATIALPHRPTCACQATLDT